MTSYQPMLNPTVILWQANQSRHDPRDWCSAQCKKRVDVVRTLEGRVQASYLAVDTLHGESAGERSHVLPGPIALFMFEDPEEAMMFKLVWGGQ